VQCIHFDNLFSVNEDDMPSFSHVLYIFQKYFINFNVEISHVLFNWHPFVFVSEMKWLSWFLPGNSLCIWQGYWFFCSNFDPITYLNSCISAYVLLVFSIHNIVFSTNSARFNSSFPIWMTLNYISYPHILTRTSRIMLYKNVFVKMLGNPSILVNQ
jgi:hypothetical protein